MLVPEISFASTAPSHVPVKSILLKLLLPPYANTGSQP